LSPLFYLRLIGFTAGTVVYLFILALILGHRRPRRLERSLFFLILSLFLIYGGGLLEMNTRIQYASPPDLTRVFYQSLLALGCVLLVPLIWDTQIEYFRQVRQKPLARPITVATAVLYALSCVLMLIEIAFAVRAEPAGRLEVLLWALDVTARNVVVVGAALSVPLFWVAFRAVRNHVERRLFVWLLGASSGLVVFLILQKLSTAAALQVGPALVPAALHELFQTAAVLCGFLPGVILAWFFLRRNFLEFGAQRNLVYALSATLLALLYFALVRRISGWLEPVLPPEATAAILIFVLIFLFEPLERVIGPLLHRRFRESFAPLQKLTSDLQEQARQGDLARLLQSAEGRIRDEFGLAAVRISLAANGSIRPLETPGGLGHSVRMPLIKEGREIGALEAASTGAFLTGETSAALEFLAEHLPATIDFCGLIEEKVRLERELADRERLALLGQMAASVSHTLRNPLSSMKTVLQVQLENPDLPLDARRDCALVVEQIDRMSAKLTQLLRFAKPSVNGQRVSAVVLARQTAALFGRDAERRSIRLELEQPSEDIMVLASEEALSEILSNLVVNAIEAQPQGGRVRIGLVVQDTQLAITVEDDGPGISPEHRARIFQPYFTTKSTGTGLGLSIVARRVSEMGGALVCESPVYEGKGTRFRISLPIAQGANP
jgi:signal transduction histidine kinase